MISIPDYKKMYLQLFHATEEAIKLLVEAQQKCEELYIADEPTVTVFPSAPDAEET